MFGVPLKNAVESNLFVSTLNSPCYLKLKTDAPQWIFSAVFIDEWIQIFGETVPDWLPQVEDTQIIIRWHTQSFGQVKTMVLAQIEAKPEQWDSGEVDHILSHITEMVPSYLSKW